MKKQTYANDATMNIDAETLASRLSDSVHIQAEWEKGNENGFADALRGHTVDREGIYNLLREQVGDADRKDSTTAGYNGNPFADFPEIRTAEADCGGGSEAAYFAELENGWTVGYATGGFYYAVPESAVSSLPVPVCAIKQREAKPVSVCYSCGCEFRGWGDYCGC